MSKKTTVQISVRENNSSTWEVSKDLIKTDKKQKTMEVRNTDPSGAKPSGKSYPIPSFFEHRFKPKDHDSL